MPTASVHPQESGVPSEQQAGIDARKAGGVIAWSSFVFAVLQSVCTFFAAVDGLRVAIGVGALVLGAGVGGFVHQLHSDLIRLPMNLAHGIFNKTDQAVKCFFWVTPTRKLYDLFWAIHSMKEQSPPEVVALSAKHEVMFLPPPE